MTSGQDYCPDPGREPCSDWGASSWFQTSSERYEQCYGQEDPPPPPTDPGDGGSENGPTSVPGMPQTMPIQLGSGGCVPASLAQVQIAMCDNGSKTPGQIEGAMFQYGYQKYGMTFTYAGVPLSGMNSFVNHFFTTTILQPAGNFQGAINAGHPIMIDVFSHMDGPDMEVWHSVVITGYNPNNVNQVYYLDPGTGTTHTGDAASLYANSHYAIPITGCK